VFLFLNDTAWSYVATIPFSSGLYAGYMAIIFLGYVFVQMCICMLNRQCRILLFIFNNLTFMMLQLSLIPLSNLMSGFWLGITAGDLYLPGLIRTFFTPKSWWDAENSRCCTCTKMVDPHNVVSHQRYHAVIVAVNVEI